MEPTAKRRPGRPRTKPAPDLGANVPTKGKNGGVRPGAGRKVGTQPKSAKTLAIEAAKDTGLLPHEWLLKVARGEPIEHKEWVVVHDKDGVEVSKELRTRTVYADFPTRLDAAKAAAPFYAPRLAVQALTTPKQDYRDLFCELAKSLPV